MNFTETNSLFRGRLIPPYQTAGVRRMHECDSGAGGFLADDMGLGKTIQTIYMILSRPPSVTLLIVPKMLLRQWHTEIQKFAPTIDIYRFGGKNKFIPDRGTIKRSIVVTTYNTLIQKTSKKIFSTKFDRVVMDEGHELRNPNSKKYKVLRNIFSASRWVLTGTPIINSKRDFLTLCSFILNTDRILNSELELMKTKYFIRRTKKAVAELCERNRLPPLNILNVELLPYPEEDDRYRDAFTSCTQNTNPLSSFLRCRQVQAHPSLYPLTPKYTGRCKKMDYTSTLSSNLYPLSLV